MRTRYYLWERALPAMMSAIREKNREQGSLPQRRQQMTHDTFWGGYAGYFQDLDGHIWEVAWNPQLLPE